MIYGNKAFDHGQDAYESAWEQAEREVVSAYWDDPWGIVSEYLAGPTPKTIDDDLIRALAPNPTFDRDVALSAGLAMARIVKAARSSWVERRRDEILDKAGA